MSKIVRAINAMIANEKKISSVMKGQNGEIFFLFDGKYKWSTRKGEDGTYLWFYPVDADLRTLAGVDDWDGIPMVTYRASEIGTREAKESFEELYLLVKEKLYGVDDVLNDIIGQSDDGVPF